jgi:L-fuconolactonase
VPNLPIVDTHLHLWDPSLISYPWLAGNELLNRRFGLDDYWSAFTGIDVESMVFVQCEADPSAFLDEAAWIARQAQTDPRIKGMVAWAPLEKGRAVAIELEALRNHDILRGIRRIIQFEDDIDFCLRPDFIEGVRTLAEFGLSFDICIDHRHMANILHFAEKTPDVPMLLDHIGKPSIRTGAMQPWANHMRELARFPHVSCKVSGVATEASPDWSPADLRPFIDVAFAEFGFGRTMFGGDWPVTLQALEPTRWIAILDDVLSAATESARRAFWHDNAIRFYRLE